MTAQNALEHHLAEEERARRRLMFPDKHRGEHHRPKPKHNRAASERDWKREARV